MSTVVLAYCAARDAGATKEAARLLDALVRESSGLVWLFAGRLGVRPGDPDVADVMQAGRIGLWHAAQTYDPTRGAWSTWAAFEVSYRIRTTREVAHAVRHGRPPRRLRQEVAAIRARNPGPQEIASEAQRLGVPAQHLQAWLAPPRYAEVDHVQAHPGANPERLAIARQELELVAGALAGMRPFEQAVIAALDEERDDEAVAREWRLGTRWLRRTRANARRKLAQAIEGKAA
jgi:RNA polymerase sigma factor (sigma-70 family)